MPISPRHLVFQWHITERCTWRCKHCYQESYTTPEMNIADLFRVRDQFNDLLNSFEIRPSAHIQITGGEPFIRTDILEFLAGIAKFRELWSWSLMSNGSLLDRENVKFIKQLGVGGLQVSMEGMEKTNDDIRNKGAFGQTVKAIELLQEVGIPTRVSLTLSRKNKDEVFALAKFLASLGVETLGARRIVPWGRGAEMKEYLMEPEEISDFYRSIEDMNTWMIQHDYRLRIVGGCESGFFYDQVRTHPETWENLMNQGWCGVKEGRIIVILPDGAVLPCRRLPIPVGKLFKQTLTEIYNSPAMMAFRDPGELAKISACQSCVNWKNCFGGALCVNYGLTRRLDIPDVQCKRAFRSLEEAKQFAATK